MKQSELVTGSCSFNQGGNQTPLFYLSLLNVGPELQGEWTKRVGENNLETHKLRNQILRLNFQEITETKLIY